MKKIIFILPACFLLCLSSYVKAQDKSELLSRAFSSSYSSEYTGKYGEAIGFLKEVYADDNYEINLRLGWLYYSYGKYVESNTYYQKALALLPLSIEAKFGKILPLAALEKWEEVEALYLDILKIDSKNTLANYRLGLLLYGQNKFEASEKYFRQVVNLYPFDYDSLLMLGWAGYKQGKLREAKVLFQKCLLARPGDQAALEAIALIK